MEDDDEVMIEMEFPLSSLRLMHLCVSVLIRIGLGAIHTNRSRLSN